MHPLFRSPPPHALGGFLRPLLTLAFMIPLASIPARSADSAAVPPAFPDSAHVLQGCYVSTVAYLARFRAAYPHERAVPLPIEAREFRGLHTIAVVSWRGTWWGRDEHFGVFSLGCKVAREPDPTRLDYAATKSLLRHVKEEIEAGRGDYPTRPSPALPTAARLQAVTQAAALLPCASELFWVAHGGAEIPLLFFRPEPGTIAVYDPLTGTAQAACTDPDPARVVKTIATLLGYRVERVRRDLNHLLEPRLALAEPARP